MEQPPDWRESLSQNMSIIDKAALNLSHLDESFEEPSRHCHRKEAGCPPLQPELDRNAQIARMMQRVDAKRQCS
jgi:hypothetical protein